MIYVSEGHRNKIGVFFASDDVWKRCDHFSVVYNTANHSAVEFSFLIGRFGRFSRRFSHPLARQVSVHFRKMSKNDRQEGHWQRFSTWELLHPGKVVGSVAVVRVLPLLDFNWSVRKKKSPDELDFFFSL